MNFNWSVSAIYSFKMAHDSLAAIMKRRVPLSVGLRLPSFEPPPSSRHRNHEMIAHAVLSETWRKADRKMVWLSGRARISFAHFTISLFPPALHSPFATLPSSSFSSLLLLLTLNSSPALLCFFLTARHCAVPLAYLIFHITLSPSVSHSNGIASLQGLHRINSIASTP